MLSEFKNDTIEKISSNIVNGSERGKRMKEKVKDILSKTTTKQLIWWWLFRGAMIFAMIAGTFRETYKITDTLQVLANFTGMFAWEIFQLFPKKSSVRFLPSYLQNFSVVLIFCASFCGYFMNFYYDLVWWDWMLHFLGGAGLTILGYEVAVCLQKKNNTAVPFSIMLLCAAGFSFMFGTIWELFEFTFDQVSLIGGSIGDAQHWSLELAFDTPKMQTLFAPIDDTRWPLMDTMGDIVLNTLGCLCASVFLKFNPYHHKQKKENI